MVPPILRILETALYVEDVARAREFYVRLFGFPVVMDDDRLCALRVGDFQVLLLFRRGGTTQAVRLPGGVLPPHDGSGESHFAFLTPAESLEQWVGILEVQGVELESRVQWEVGAESLYFRDPDRHLVEITTPGLWGISG